MYKNSDLPLSIQAWLATDTYVKNPDVISASQFVKSVRQNILIERARAQGKVASHVDITSMMASRSGTATHAAIEHTWVSGQYAVGLEVLGLPTKSIAKIHVNPDDDFKVPRDDIAVYMEKFVEAEGWDNVWVGGTADCIWDGQLQDFKETSTFSYGDAGKLRAYTIQGSIYRFAAPQLITEDVALFIEMYKDWTAGKAFGAKYPPERIVAVPVTLWSITETGAFIRERIMQLDKFTNAPDHKIPYCDDTTLWRGASTFKYYSDAANKKASAVFDNEGDALREKRTKGKGIVVEHKPKAKACNYCEASAICGQAALMRDAGEL